MKIAPKPPNPPAADVFKTLRQSRSGLTLAQLLTRYPQLPRRTAQRWLSQWVGSGQISPQGEGRARRYVTLTAPAQPAGLPMALSPDSNDIAAYVQRPLQARKPVGYQHEFLAAYEPNRTWYLSEPLRRQLRKMGDTGQGTLPAGTHSRAVLNRLLIDLSWASSHLEGNTYSRLDTRELIEHGKAAQGKAAIETQMILNHKAAIEMLVDNAASARFNRYLLLNLHSALAENLLPNPADEGRIRQHAVEIAHSVYRPLSVPQQIDAQLDALLQKAQAIADPFEQSFFMMVHLPYLRPFADINKRTSRLLANLPLFRANLCPLTFLGVPEPEYSRAILGVYELTRIELLRDVYVWAYERSTQEYIAIKQDLAQPDPSRLAYRDVIKRIIHAVVSNPAAEPLKLVRQGIAKQVAAADRDTVQSLVLEELRRLHEGVLSRYGLRPSQLDAWKLQQAQAAQAPGGAARVATRGRGRQGG